MGAGDGRKKGEVTLAKEAAERVEAWLAGGAPYAAERYADLRLVLCHYAKLCKKPRNGRSVARKGYVFENQSVNYLKSRGLECSRVPLSGAGEEKGDIRLKTGWGQALKGEAKSRGKLADWIVNALGDHDFVLLKQDRGETYVLTRLPTFADLCQ
jgi:hypothetical protein